ncbi:hypothetical protein HQ571_00025 [Candidatus Kuenenbacteria bacterium]|nr:hypothetical protein [Candidatus Kuenenbacteria bacterium]
MKLLIKVEMPCGHKVTITRKHLAHKVVTCFQCTRSFDIREEWRTDWSDQLGEKKIRPDAGMEKTRG